ncbi:MAG: hypothetical protein ACT4PV_16020 [Planctomycetaceae bacterium]
MLLKLRLLEARRRGGLILLALAALAVAAVAATASGPFSGRFSLATDLAALLGFLAALFYGALPLAADRERRRLLLPTASPATPWGLAAANAAGAAATAGLATLLLFAAAGAGSALHGGLETRVAAGFRGDATIWIRPGQTLPLEIKPGVEKLRFSMRVFSPGEMIGSTGLFPIEADGRRLHLRPGQEAEVAVQGDLLKLRNPSDDALLGIDPRALRTLGARRPFLVNAVAAGLAPALAAAALAALAAAFSAGLAGPVAALLAGLVLLLGSMKAFLLETTQPPPEEEHAAHHGHAHAHDHAPPPPPDESRLLVRAMLAALPDLGAFDRSDRASRGEWIGLEGAAGAALFLAVALALAAVGGGLGLQLRRVT